MQETRLFRKNSLGVGTWRVYESHRTSSCAVICIAHSVVEGGSEVVHTDEVRTNGSGRNLDQQVTLEMQSRINRQLDKGYKPTREEALLGSTNQLGLVNPMLAQPLGKVTLRGSDFGYAYVQRKFDGHRCLITKQNGDMYAYSRKGKLITTIPHILEDAERWMQDGDTIDGELYIHGQMLQTIGSLIKREQPGSRQLNYNWYDIKSSLNFHHRHALMKDLFANVAQPQIHLVETIRVYKMSEVYTLFKQHRDERYEGSMLRLSIAGYEDGKRSNQLIKVKAREDGEVKVIGCRPSSQGWAILRVQFVKPYTTDVVEFDMSAPGSVEEKTEVLKNFEEKYKGKDLTIEYAMLTADGIPFHAVATRWREDV